VTREGDKNIIKADGKNLSVTLHLLPEAQIEVEAMPSISITRKNKGEVDVGDDGKRLLRPEEPKDTLGDG